MSDPTVPGGSGTGPIPAAFTGSPPTVGPSLATLAGSEPDGPTGAELGAAVNTGGAGGAAGAGLAIPTTGPATGAATGNPEINLATGSAGLPVPFGPPAPTVPTPTPIAASPAATEPAVPIARAVDPQAGGSGLLPTSQSDDVQLLVKGLTITGWSSVSIMRGIEVMPSTFDISLTERYPGQPNTVDITAGDPCSVYIGSTLVLTGYVDRRMPSIGPGGNVVRIIGRSKCQDLVDCDVDPDQLAGMQIAQADAFSIITNLAAQYKIQTQILGNVEPTIIKQFNVNLGDTVFAIIEQVARWSALLVYDEVDGTLNVASVGVDSMASGFSEGRNIEQGAALEGMDQRYSVVDVYITSTNVVEGGAAMPPLLEVQDNYPPVVPRMRKLVVIAEQATLAPDFAERRGKWEVARRYGRSNVCSLTVDSWRDGAGTLWHVNAFASLDAPHLKLTGKNWIISQVTFRRDKSGTHADIVLMPKEGFMVEPVIQPLDQETAAALQAGGGAAAPGPSVPLPDPGPAVAIDNQPSNPDVPNTPLRGAS